MNTVSLNKKELPLKDLMPIIAEHLSGGQSVKISPKGTSMLPLLRQGTDCVLLSPPKRVIKKFDIVLYQRDGSQYVLHRIVKTGDTFVCVGDNQFFLEKGVRKEQIIALVDEIFRGGRKVDVHAPLYKAYCIIWYYSRPIRRIYRALKRRLKAFLEK